MLCEHRPFFSAVLVLSSIAMWFLTPSEPDVDNNGDGHEYDIWRAHYRGRPAPGQPPTLILSLAIKHHVRAR